MARIRVTFDGRLSVNGSALLMHNERLADPLDLYSQWLAELSKKRTKTERDIEEMGRREFLGAGYWAKDDGPEDTESAEPFIPTWNIIRCLQAAATRYKLGKHIIRGIVPVEDETTLQYDGPRTTKELWESGLFHSRKGVAVGQRRVIRTRPCFTDWKVEAELELDLTILDAMQVNQIAAAAGRYEGLGDARPRFGRFLGSAELLADPSMFRIPDRLDIGRDLAAQKSARDAIETADKEHSEKHPSGVERAKRVLAKTT